MSPPDSNHENVTTAKRKKQENRKTKDEKAKRSFQC